jgi:hypothetical protein
MRRETEGSEVVGATVDGVAVEDGGAPGLGERAS